MDISDQFKGQLLIFSPLNHLYHHRRLDIDNFCYSFFFSQFVVYCNWCFLEGLNYWKLQLRKKRILTVDILSWLHLQTLLIFPRYLTMVDIAPNHTIIDLVRSLVWLIGSVIFLMSVIHELCDIATDSLFCDSAFLGHIYD